MTTSTTGSVSTRARRGRTRAAIAALLALGSSGWGATHTVATEPQLRTAVQNLVAGDTVLVADGTYTLTDTLYVRAANVTIRGQSGQRARVVVQGDAMSATARVGNVFRVESDGVRIQDLTLQRCRWHLIQITGDQDTDGLTVSNCVLRDSYEQMLKGSIDPANTSVASDRGLVENCLFEYTAGIGPQWYIGGIDVHGGRDWIVRGNTFRNIISPNTAVAEFAVHFWNNSADNLVERNVIVDCDRGIGFGLGDRGNSGGIIRNNMISHANRGQYTDAGIALANSPGSQVVGNTVYSDHAFPWAIEYRFTATQNVRIADNLTNRPILARDGASGSVGTNVTNATASWFVAPAAGDLHLASRIASVVDAGVAVAGLVTDIDGQARPQGAGIDIGADELVSGGNQAPTVSLTGPTAGATYIAPASIALAATAADSDGGIAKVEFLSGSTLLGTDTTSPYAMTWSGVAAGSYALTARATDTLGAVTTSAPVPVSVSAAPSAGTYSLWPASATPAVAAAADAGAVEVGVKFRTDVPGTITGLRFYKGAGNVGTHTGHLWSRAGALLGSVTFSAETGSGWQQASFASPVAIAAGTTYIASYFAPGGHYAYTSSAFAAAGVDSGPLHALRDGVDGGNGVYRYGATSGFPTQSWNATNYWVDVVFSTAGGGLQGQYWSNQAGTFSGAPTLTRIDPRIDFAWGTGSPASGISTDQFSVRWTGSVRPPSSGSWTFSTVSDDGVRLWVDGRLLIDNWTDHRPTTDSATITLTGGQLYAIRMDYYERGGGATARLLWSSGGTATPVTAAKLGEDAALGDAIPAEALYPAAADVATEAEPVVASGGSAGCGLGGGIALLAGLLLVLGHGRRVRGR